MSSSHKPLLDTTKIRTVEDLNNTGFAKYANTEGASWVRYTVNRTLPTELNRLCALSEEVGTKIQLKHELGRLYYKMRKCKTPKYKLIKLTVEDIAHVSEYLKHGTRNIINILTKITTQGLPMQKYHEGDLVKIAEDLGASMSHFTAGCKAIVMYSYEEKYGSSSGSAEKFCVYIKGKGPVSWYKEHQLTLIKPNCFDLLDGWEEEDKSGEDY